MKRLEGEALATHWHYTTFVNFLDHWQPLLAGLLGSAAAIVVVWLTLGAERRRSKRELDALKRSIGVEIRQCLTACLGAHDEYRRLAKSRSGVLTARMIEDAGNLFHPVVFPAIAGRVGLLGNQALDVVIIYNLLELARSAISQTTRIRTSEDVPRMRAALIAEALLKLCIYAKDVIPSLKTGLSHVDGQDAQLAAVIETYVEDWANAREEWLERRVQNRRG